MIRTYIKNIFGCDTDHFAPVQETMTQAYLLLRQGGVTPKWRKMVVSRRVAAIFSHRFVAPRRRSAPTTTSSLRLALRENY